MTIEPRSVRKGCAGRLELALLPQFLTIEPRFVRKGCAGQVEIAILPHFLAIERTSFRAKGLRFVPSRWHHPRPKERKIKKARERKGREKGEKM